MGLHICYRDKGDTSNQREKGGLVDRGLEPLGSRVGEKKFKLKQVDLSQECNS